MTGIWNDEVGEVNFHQTEYAGEPRKPNPPLPFQSRDVRCLSDTSSLAS